MPTQVQAEPPLIRSPPAPLLTGSPTLGGHMPTQVQVVLGAILREAEAKQLPCGVFGSFGWSGEAVRAEWGEMAMICCCHDDGVVRSFLCGCCVGGSRVGKGEGWGPYV